MHLPGFLCTDNYSANSTVKTPVGIKPQELFWQNLSIPMLTIKKDEVVILGPVFSPESDYTNLCGGVATPDV